MQIAYLSNGYIEMKECDGHDVSCESAFNMMFSQINAKFDGTLWHIQPLRGEVMARLQAINAQIFTLFLRNAVEKEVEAGK